MLDFEKKVNKRSKKQLFTDKIKIYIFLQESMMYYIKKHRISFFLRKKRARHISDGCKKGKLALIFFSLNLWQSSQQACLFNVILRSACGRLVIFPEKLHNGHMGFRTSHTMNTSSFVEYRRYTNVLRLTPSALSQRGHPKLLTVIGSGPIFKWLLIAILRWNFYWGVGHPCDSWALTTFQ